MKKFNTPVVEVINFQVEDIICVSNEFSGEGSGGFPVQPPAAPTATDDELVLEGDELWYNLFIVTKKHSS